MKQCKHPTCGPVCRREKKQIKGFGSKALHDAAGSDREQLKVLPQPLLMKIAINEFNAYIRLRDWKSGCISCGTGKVEHAGHCLPAGTYSGVRLNEMNVNGQCSHCNTLQDGNREGYHTGMVQRYGAEAVQGLTVNAERTKFYKWARPTLIEVIIEYRTKIANLKA